LSALVFAIELPISRKRKGARNPLAKKKAVASKIINPTAAWISEGKVGITTYKKSGTVFLVRIIVTTPSKKTPARSNRASDD
jgi:hypothetical protein